MGAELDALYICMVDAKTAGFYEGIEFGRELALDVKLGALTNAAVAYAEAVLNSYGLRG